MESACRDFYEEAGLRWKLNETACALIRQLYGEFESAEALAKVVKCSVREVHLWQTYFSA